MGDYKLILGYPGLYDGWEQDDNLDLTHITDVYGINARDAQHTRGSYSFDWAAITQYAIALSETAVLYNVMGMYYYYNFVLL